MMPRPTWTARRNEGVVLIVVLVMLVVIGLASASVMRATLGADEVTNNTRNQTVAALMADAGLRYCEGRVIKVPSDPDYMAPWPQAASGVDTPGHWESFGNWHGSGAIAVTVPAAFITSTQTGAESAYVPRPPQCLPEERILVDGTRLVLVTARGFSPDFEADAQGHTISGSASWSQVTLRIGP